MPDAPGWQFPPAHLHPGRRLSPPGRGILPVRERNILCDRKKMRFENWTPKGRVGLRWESGDVLDGKRIS